MDTPSFESEDEALVDDSAPDELFEPTKELNHDMLLLNGLQYKTFTYSKVKLQVPLLFLLLHKDW